MNVLHRDDFLGAAINRHAAGPFSFGHWYATPSGDAVRPHGHADAHFMFVVAGRYATQVDGRGPHLIYNPPGTFHRDRFEGGGSFFAVSLARELVEETKLPATPTRVMTPVAHALVARLMRESASWLPDSPLVAQALCLELVSAAGPPERTDSAPPRWLGKAREMLQQRVASDVNLHDIAAAARVHPIHLTRTFRRFYRCTPGDYLRSLRVSRAAQLLSSTTMPLSEVALESGFADQSHFTKVFRRACGVAPGRYRSMTS